MRYLFIVVLSLFSWTIGFAQISVFPHNEDFETFSSCFESCLAPCALTSGWVNPTTDGSDWIVDSVGTPTAGTGPSANGGADHNPGIAGGKYLYLESTSCANTTGFLETPQLDFTGGTHPYMTYWYHMYGGSMGTLHIDVSINNGTTYTNNVVPAITSNSNVWQQAVVDLSAYAGQIIKVRFRGITGAGSSSDMAIDDVSFFLVEEMNVGVYNIQSNDSLFCDYSTNQLCVEIVNTDTISLDSGILNVRINGTLFNSPFPFTSSIAAGDTGVICLGQAALAAGDVVSAVISMPNGVPDPTAANDSLAETIVLQALPVINITPDTMTCPGDTIVIGGSPTGPVGSTVLWSNTGGYLSGTTITNPMVSVVGTETYYVQVTSDIGCVNTDSVEVSNLALPVVDAGADVALCPSVSYTFGGSPTSATGVNFEWFGPNGNSIATVANPTLVINNIGQYIVSVEDANTCVNTDTMVITAPANVLPNAGNDTTVCIGNSAQIGDVASPAYNYYNWSPGALLNDSTVSNPTALASSNVQYLLEVQDTFGCVLYDTMNLNIYALPLVDAGANSTICLQDSFTLGGSPTSATATSFLWMPGGLLTDSTVANPIAAVISDTTYYLTVTDANGCVNSDTIEISIDTLPQVNAGADLSICFGDAALIGGFPAGAPGSMYNWSPGALLDDSTLSNPTYIVSANQTFILELTDANGCQGYDTMNVTINTSSVLPSTPDTTVCLGDTFLFSSTPSAAFTSFSWSSTAYTTNVNANPIETFVTGTTEYILAATDTFGCGYVDTIMVFAYAPVAIDAGPDVQVCLNDSVTLGGSPSGNAGSSFSWSASGLLNNNTLANPLAVGLSDTSFVLTVTDINTCEAYDTVTLSVLALPVIDAGVDQSACVGTSVALGGAPSGHVSSSFSWSPSSGLSNITLANPVYMVLDTTDFVLSVTDTNGCVSLDTVRVNAFPVTNLIAQNDTVVCENVTPLIGNAQPAVFTAFNWSPGVLTTDSALAQTTAIMTASTEYTLMATDVYGCVYYDTVQVDIQPSPIADAGADDEICFGETISLGGSPTGPVGSSYSWSSNFAGFTNGDTNANPSVSFNTAGTFEFVAEVSDSIGCPTLDTVNITVRTPVTADAGTDQIICTGDSTTIGGAPTGLANSTFAWTSAAFLSNAAAQNPITTVTDTTVFTLIVQDTFGCFGYDTLTVNTFPIPVLNAGADTSICVGESVALGGAPTSTSLASVVWSPGQTLNDSTVSNPVATPLATTTYTATVTDLNGCVFTDDVIVGVNVLPVVDAGPDTLTNCAFAGFAVGGAPTGPAGSTYQWSPSNVFNFDTVANPIVLVTGNTTLFLEVEDNNGCINYDTIEVLTYPIPNVEAGLNTVIVCEGDTAQLGGSPTSTSGVTYQWSSSGLLSDPTAANPTAVYPSPMYFFVVVTDTVNGCTNADSVFADHYPNPIVDAGLNDTICIGDSVQVGGSPTSLNAISYSWTPNGGTISYDTASNPFVAPITTTAYIVNAIDNQGCTGADTVVVAVNQLPTITMIAETTPCPGDTIQITATGGQSYQWTNNTYFSSLTAADPFVLFLDTTTVTVQVTDSNLCVNIDSLVVNPHPQPFADAGVDLDVCAGQSVQLQAVSATSPSWSPDSSLNNAFVLNPVATPPVTTDYILTSSTGAGACSITDTMTVNRIPLPVVTLADTVEYCDFSLGDVAATNSEDLSFDWSVNTTDIILNNPQDSALMFTASDSGYIYLEFTSIATGCIGYDSVFVVWYPKPVATASGTPSINCIGDSIQLGVFGGDLYQWVPSIGLTNAVISNPILEVYADTTLQVFVTTNEGCADTIDVPIAAADLVIADAGPNVEICQLDTIQLSASGGLNYQWTNDATLSDNSISSPFAYPAVTKIYTVTASDQYGCIGVDNVVVTVNPLPNVSAGIPKRVCLNSQVQIGGNPTGPSGATYSWSPAASIDDATLSNPFVSPSINTMYYVTVTSNKGCLDSSNVFVTVDSLPTLNLITEPIAVCRGDSTLIEVTSGINKYNWTPGATVDDSSASSVNVFPKQSTVYNVIATNGRGCSSSLDISVEIFQLPVMVQQDPEEVCLGDSVQIEVSSSTGVTYRWEPTAYVSDSLSAKTFAKPVETIDYEAFVTDENGCVNSVKQRVRVNELPYADAGDDIATCDINAVYLGGNKTANPGDLVSWSPEEYLDNPYALNPLALTAERKMFYLTVQNDKGCITEDSILVNADCFALIYAPNAFTPGTNGINDEFLLTYYRVIEPKLTIFNRWGEEVFVTEDLTIGWDGIVQGSKEEALSGVYFWVLIYKSEDNKKLTKEGKVTLLR